MNASKMTIITGLKYEVVETTEPSGRFRVSSFSLDGFKKPILGEDIAPDSICCREFYISGRRICTPNGKEVFLRNAPGVEEFLGLQIDFFENQRREKEKALYELSKAEWRVKELESKAMERAKVQWKWSRSFFRRLKSLFTGELV